MTLLWVIFGMLIAVLLAAYGGFRLVFYAGDRQKARAAASVTPAGAAYDPYREQMERWVQALDGIPCTPMEIRSFDGLTLRGRLYLYAPDAPVEIMFHGYRGTAARDLSGGVARARLLGHSALLVDQRGSPGSEGRVITFGVREWRDCLAWIEHVIGQLGDVPIILTGISMGAATVLNAAAHPLHRNVVGVLADCGYTSPKAIIMKILRQLHLPAGMLYPLLRLGARLYGGFDPEEITPVGSLQHCALPVIFFHGEADSFVPCTMSRENYAACPSRKRLVIVPGAGHGLSYPADPERYLNEMRDFFGI